MANEDIRKVFGRRIRKLRQQRDWKLVDLAAHSGYGRVFLTNLENGKHEPKLSTIKALAGSFGITASQLLKGI